MTDIAKKLITVFLEAPDSREKILNRLSELMELVIHGLNWWEPDSDELPNQKEAGWMLRIMNGADCVMEVGDVHKTDAIQIVSICFYTEDQSEQIALYEKVITRKRPQVRLYGAYPSIAACKIFEFATLLKELPDREELWPFALEAGQKAALHTASVLGQEVVWGLLDPGNGIEGQRK